MEANFAVWKARAEITAHARLLGFDLVGFTGAKVSEKHAAAFKEWLEMKHEGGMAYLRDTEKIEKRSDMTKILPGAKSLVCVAMNYYRPQPSLKRGYGRVARYAYGRDYHKIMGRKLRRLARFVEECGVKYFPGEVVRTKSFVDVGPIFERAFAEQAGLGVIGKNSLLITKEFGSWVLLGEVLTTLPLAFETPAPNKEAQQKAFGACGSCTRCVQACPTGAIIKPGVIDARLCISYLTIEHKGRIPAKLAGVIKKTRRVFGCDICQEVCPHNSRQKPTAHEEFTNPAIAQDGLFLQTISKINTDSLFHRKFAGSALKRAKRGGLRRNAGIITH